MNGYDPRVLPSNENIFIKKLNDQELDIDDHMEKAFTHKFKRIHTMDRYGHIIQKFRILETEYGMRLAVFFEDFYIHLPPRLSLKFTRNTEIGYLNELLRNQDVMFKFGGYSENGKMKIKFIVAPDDNDFDDDPDA